MILASASSRLLTHFHNTTGTGANDVTPPNTGKRPILISTIEVTEAGGLTPNLTIVVYDPRNAASYFKANQRPMLARESVDFKEVALPQGWQLLVTVSTGTCTVLVNYFDPNASGVSA